MKLLQLVILFFSCLLISQIREINTINNDINSEIAKIESSDFNRKTRNLKIDSLHNIRFEKYAALIQYFNAHPEKQYYLKKADSTRKLDSFRESYLKLFDKKYLPNPNRPYSTNLKFSLTPEGNLIDVSAEGKDEKFSILSMITLYKLLREFEPYIADKSKVIDKVQTFILPIQID